MDENNAFFEEILREPKPKKEYSEKALELMNSTIAGEILVKGKVDNLILHLRNGDAPHLSQETWDIVAGYLEGKYRKPGRKDEYQRCRERDIGIAKNFFEMRQLGVKQKDAYEALAKQFNTSDSIVRRAVNAARNKNKRIFELEKQTYGKDGSVLVN